MISIKDLVVSFDTFRGKLQAVRGVSLHINKGEIVCLVGESGSGKSVTAQSMLRLINDRSIQSGSIEIDSFDILKSDKKSLARFRGKHCGMIFQEPGRSFDPLYTIGKTFHETIKAHNSTISDKAIFEKSLSLLKEVGIYNAEERLGNYPHQLSGGQLQRVMIALSIASDPDYLIADEPTTALDVTIQRKIVELIKRLSLERGLTVVFITHDLSLVKDFADKVIVMYSGIILEQGNVDDIFNHPKHPYTTALIKSIPKAGANYKNEKLISIEGVVPDPVYPPPGCPFASRCLYTQSICTVQIPHSIQTDSYSQYRCILTPEELKTRGANVRN